MKTRLLALCALLFVGVVVPGCRCDDDVQTVKPSLAVTPPALKFGKVKAGGQAELLVTLAAQTRTSVTITDIRLADGTAPGGAQFFSVVDAPTSVESLSETQFRIRFSPEIVQGYGATLIIQSNDDERPSVELPITGEGADPLLSVIPDCSAMRKCKGTATIDPPAIDYGPEPLLRAVEIPSTELPRVTMINEGDVELVVTGLSITGRDEKAFSFVGNDKLPHQLPDGTPALILAAGEGQGIPIRFKPTSETQNDYQAEVVITSDDPAHSEVRVALSGTLGPNLPPQVCANIVQALPGDLSTPTSWDTKAHWDALLTPPEGGYDFRQSRDIQPNSTVRLSAFSNAADARTCTTDPEDQRTGLQFEWTLREWPQGAAQPVIASANTPNPSLITVATGEYEILLTVRDAQGHSTQVPLRFAVALKEDLVVQLSWNGQSRAYADVDFDLHLVRPSAVDPAGGPFSGAFDWFDPGTGKTAGDINGYSYTEYLNHKPNGFNYDWGMPGTADDPRLNLDDIGDGELLENISLNYPERDAACADGPCTYKVFVHYFSDGRQHGTPVSCTVGNGCKDGEACDCGSGTRCIAIDAPVGAAATGPGRCLPAPEPVVRIFLKSSAIPAATIPLDTLTPPDRVALPAPCQMLYVADVVWPAAGTGGEPQLVIQGQDSSTGRITSPVIGRFGQRAGGLSCAPDMDADGNGQPEWYSEQPR